MNDALIVEAVGFVVAIIAIVKPIVNLNDSITMLSASVKALEKTVDRNSEATDARLAAHGTAIDELQQTTAKHGVRIENIEEELKK